MITIHLQTVDARVMRRWKMRSIPLSAERFNFHPHESACPKVAQKQAKRFDVSSWST